MLKSNNKNNQGVMQKSDEFLNHESLEKMDNLTNEQKLIYLSRLIQEVNERFKNSEVGKKLERTKEES